MKDLPFKLIEPMYRADGKLGLFCAMRHLYPGKAFAVEYADETGEYGNGDRETGAQRILWEDEGEGPTQSEVESKLAEVTPIIELAWLRHLRTLKLAESDWTQSPDIPETLKAKWATYRQALRDLPANTKPADYRNPNWPTEPS